ncbi:pseudouridine synthase PUS1 [Ascoidea rubescens DSM 1968]|uniref:tRNA pseudouridine synthase 1 n=1 Tax=Ascoidea rubescens DSM 1968 TaxID=1344418 RepID=A0A1D2VQA8_9ASCO|nr:tRNA pseudouridine synthase [Ascoidea rubescens DSM 1968]ODV63786.1 tRNA pseudouridine synthase [Ascoidea rubescens DSM 1968]
MTEQDQNNLESISVGTKIEKDVAVAPINSEVSTENNDLSKASESSSDKQLLENTNKASKRKFANGRKKKSDNYNTERRKKQKFDKESDKIKYGAREPALDENGNPIPKSERKPKRKVAVLFGYCGTGYHGLQFNGPEKTIESAIFKAFVDSGAISKENATDLKKNGFQRAARTDKGVHAAGNTLSLKLIIEDPNIVQKINDNLPQQIRIWGIERTNKSFDSRKMCSSRIYEYLLPTFCFLPPRPTSHLAQKIKEAAEKYPGTKRSDSEGDRWWATVIKTLEEKNVTQEKIEEAQNAIKDEKFDENDPNFLFLKELKAIENKFRRSYRISSERLELIRKAVSKYVGHHNFHNFTIGKLFKDPSSNRFMKSLTVSEPFVIPNTDTEWVSIKIHGQSFMLHQIRKMIAMATFIVRCGTPLNRISEAFKAKKMNIPKAPSLGLLLENPVYDGYNSRLVDFGYKEIDFTRYDSQMEEFKMKNIYDKIYEEEIKENQFHGFFGFIDNYRGDQSYDFILPGESDVQDSQKTEEEKDNENDIEKKEEKEEKDDNKKPLEKKSPVENNFDENKTVKESENLESVSESAEKVEINESKN